ncbi:MAG TPA: hypothetical protein VHO03_07810 [Ignavibacteriales bacterium]|nr:hypothetical protein [Ignavibacteriales bacterium]
MKIKNSDLKLDGINILGLSVDFIPSDDVNELPSLDFDINFDIMSIQEQGKFRIIMEIAYNIGKTRKGGYSFYVIGEGNYSFNNFQSKTKKEIDEFLIFSGVPILINYIRSQLATVTASFPYGQFMLPTIDMADLVRRKELEIRKAEKKAEKKVVTE